MDEAAPFTPRTLLWRGTRCLRNESPSLRPCGLRRLCRLFGIDLAARRREADLVLSVFAGLAPRHGLDRGLAPLAALVHTLVKLGDGTPDAGEIVLTHPLKRLDADANRLLAMTLTLLTVGKGRTDKVEPLLTGMGCAPDDPRRRTAVVLAAIVQVARFALNVAVCWLLAYGLAKPLVLWALSGREVWIQENVAMLVGMCLYTALNYLGQRFFAFRK